jgi:phytoene/squalene synthetase
MSIAKETPAQKRRREKEELEIAQRESEQKFEAEKSTRLLHAMARAQGLGVEAQVFYRYEDVLIYQFDFSQVNLPNSLDTFCDTVAELSEWMMDSIENQLKLVEEARDRGKRLANLKKEVLARLTDEEREALGV